MDMFKVILDENREYKIVAIAPDLTRDDAFHIMRRVVFDWEQKRLAEELAGQVAPTDNNVASLIRKRLSDRKHDS